MSSISVQIGLTTGADFSREVYIPSVHRPWTVGLLALFMFACEGENLVTVPPPVDMGFPPDMGQPDLGQPDAGFPDTGPADLGQPDSGEPPPAQEPVYIHTGRILYSYDADTNTTQQIGMFRDRQGPLENAMVDIAIDNQGRMYGGTINRAENNDVFQIDPETGYCFYKFSFNDQLNGMAFLDDGRLVIAGERISVVDPDDGTLLLEFPAAQMYETSGDVVGLPDGQLYWTVRNEDNNDGVVRIDPIRGTVTWLGEARLGRLYGLGYANGELYGFSSMGFVVTIDPATGNVLRQDMLDGRWNGATTNPVVWD